ncbi:MAG: cell division protein FtsI [Rhodobacteraceae bacterium]|nr:cell division protein FtsI [Paracoccaceae bacterium]MBT4283769.1 penicillin-binding protein 2 [Paracoccaceae bacterium]|tara:strand:+ start:18388 stop:20166 length:1779 start_codon:yes stop_codon:yes gene_type:complete
MIRVPLRPLAHILAVRSSGGNPDDIEKQNVNQRYIAYTDLTQKRAERRLFFVGIMFLISFVLVCARMTVLASSEVSSVLTEVSPSNLISQRSNILDRNGNILATNLPTFALYARPQVMIRPQLAVKKLIKIFPDLNAKKMLIDFTGQKTFLWVKDKLSPEQRQAVHEIGEPGLMYGPREMRLYPNGRFASHVLGGTRFNNQSATNADMVGNAGVEATFNNYLSDRADEGKALQLSLDLSVQAAVENILGGSMNIMRAKGATSIVLDVITGEIITMVSLPDFDPNNRQIEFAGDNANNNPLFNRAVQGVYELGSTYKVFTVAKALDLGLVDPETEIDVFRKTNILGTEVRDDHYKVPKLSVTDILTESSNVGTATLAAKIGKNNQISMLKDLGLFHPTEVELIEAKGITPLKPKKWIDSSTVTISYGYGLSMSPLHLAVAYATLINGGFKVTPTILKQDNKDLGRRVISAETSNQLRKILRSVVQRGTATLGNVEGYEVGGKTGTANKQKVGARGYDNDRVVSTFVSFFPVKSPRYVLLVSFDEPSYRGGKEKNERSAGWTAVPVAAEIIKRIAPLLNLRPSFDTDQVVQLDR